MALMEMVRAATAQSDKGLGGIHICIDWRRGEHCQSVQKAINKMDVEKKVEFITQLLETIRATHNSDAGICGIAKEELKELFGDEILRDPAVTSSEAGFFFSLSASGNQFRGWYGPFKGVNSEFFDSCGTGIVFHVHCEDSWVLRRWMKPIVQGLVEWSSPYGQIWMGFRG